MHVGRPIRFPEDHHPDTLTDRPRARSVLMLAAVLLAVFAAVALAGNGVTPPCGAAEVALSCSLG